MYIVFLNFLYSLNNVPCTTATLPLRHGDLADFWPKLSWKLVEANLIHSERFL